MHKHQQIPLQRRVITSILLNKHSLPYEHQIKAGVYTKEITCIMPEKINVITPIEKHKKKDNLFGYQNYNDKCQKKK